MQEALVVAATTTGPFLKPQNATLKIAKARWVVTKGQIEATAGFLAVYQGKENHSLSVYLFLFLAMFPGKGGMYVCMYNDAREDRTS